MSNSSFLCSRCNGCYTDYTEDILNAKNRCRRCCRTPLAVALTFCKKDSIILEILQANKDAAKIDDEEKGFPIFHAIRERCSDDVVLAILDANESAAKIKTVSGKLLLHEVITSNLSERVILKVFSVYPWAAMIRCKRTGMLPLHFAAASSTSPSIVEALIRMYPEALDTASFKDKFFPRDYVTSALPTQSIDMICKPYSKWIKDISGSGEDCKIDGVLEGMQQLKSDLACLPKEFASFSKTQICCDEQPGKTQVWDPVVAHENYTELKKIVTERDSEFHRQVLVSVQQLTDVIVSLSNDFKYFLRSQITAPQKCDAVQAYKNFTNDVLSEWKNVKKGENSSIESITGSLHELTAEVASMCKVVTGFCNSHTSVKKESEENKAVDQPLGKNHTYPIVNNNNGVDGKKEKMVAEPIEKDFALKPFQESSPLENYSGGEQPISFNNSAVQRHEDMIDEPKEEIHVQNGKRSDSSGFHSLPSEASVCSNYSKDNFNSFVFIGKAVADDGMKYSTLSKDVSIVDESSIDATISKQNEAGTSVQSVSQMTNSFIEVDFSCGTDNDSVISNNSKIFYCNSCGVSRKCMLTTPAEVKEQVLEEARGEKSKKNGK